MTENQENFYGKVYPNYDHQQLIAAFGINSSDKVLDVGGGHNPFLRADFIIDSDITDGLHRDGQKIPEELKHKFIAADIHDLPFEDKSIDFIYCSHVLEHVLDPARACSELIRVGKRGFIETPRKCSELFAGYPSHQWLIDTIEGELVFERRQFIESPYFNSMLHAVWRSKKLERNALRTFLNVSCVQFPWQDTFAFRVVRTERNAFDYMNAEHAGLSHFCFAKNILLFDAPPEQGVFHAKKAAELLPGHEACQVLLAGYALVLGDTQLREKTEGVIARLGLLSRSNLLLSKCGVVKPALLKIKSFLGDYRIEDESINIPLQGKNCPPETALAASCFQADAEEPREKAAGVQLPADAMNIPPPRTFFLELTNHCNLRCSMCNFHSPEVVQRREKGFMKKELALRLLDEVAALSPGRPWVALHGAGEPLLHSDLPEVLSHGAARGLDIGFLTNAVLLSSGMSETILSTGLSWIGFSIDGTNRELFNKYRCGADYEFVVGNVLAFLDQMHKSRPGLKTVVNMTMQEEMKDDVPDFVRFWIDKVDEVLVSPFRPVGSRDNVLARELPLTQRIPCYMLNSMMVIYWNGEVGLCCEDWFNDGRMGDTRTDSLQSIWSNQKFSHYRDLDVRGHSAEIPLCRDCNSWFNTQPLHSYDSTLACDVQKTAWQYVYSRKRTTA